ncbi:hypothetical protein Syun_020803 [Stephania yunnanensis]|uniref:Uncharacterized protein n=1 Tax=Stephania yunnanensis TaxID=152371 RepID=A0AAP0IEL2_9MAGN
MAAVGPRNLAVSDQYGVSAMDNMFYARQRHMLPSQPNGVHARLPPLPLHPAQSEPPEAPPSHLQPRPSPAKITSVYRVPPITTTTTTT